MGGLGHAVTRLPRSSKRAVLFAVDAGLCALTCYLAVYLRLGDVPPSGGPLWYSILGSIALSLPMFWLFGLYHAVLSHNSGIDLFARIARACAVYGLVFAAIFTFGGIPGIPRTVGVIQPVLLCLAVCLSRAFARSWLGRANVGGARRKAARRVLIYGAGRAGRQLYAAMLHGSEFEVIAFVDDDRTMRGRTIDGHVIVGPAEIERMVERHDIGEILLAIPSASQARRNDIIESIRHVAVRIRTLPGIMAIAHGRLTLADLHELDVVDLLGRDPVPPDVERLAERIAGRVVLVTGAGGSIGRELCRQIAQHQPATLLLFDISEFALYDVHRELAALPEVASGALRLVPLLGSVADRTRMDRVMARFAPHSVYHAAAYKHVPLVEDNIAQGVANNVFGTLTCAQAARDAGVPHFTLISTDKAVRPTNVMGTTKRAAELVLQALAADGGPTVFAMVRFGNVLGSSGSVVPLFRQQIAQGGPVTITDLRITRYFMTIPEAAQLVLQAGAMAQGGEVFVLDMGEPVRIVDLARNMIELSGWTVRDKAHPHGDIAIEEIGLRPGEKLYEELLIGRDPVATGHPRIFMAHEHHLPLVRLRTLLDRLAGAMEADDDAAMLATLKALVPEFTREGGDPLPAADLPRLYPVAQDRRG